MLLLEKVLGTLLGARLGADLAGNSSPDLQIAIRDLEGLVGQPVGATMSLASPLLGGKDSAGALLAVLPTIFLGFAEAPESLADCIVRVVDSWVKDASVREEVLYGGLVMAKVLQSSFPAPLPKGFAPPIQGATHHMFGGVLQALHQFCDAPNDYRSCLQRAARVPKAKPATAALTGAFLGAYQGIRGIPLSWQLTLIRAGTWSQYERLALTAVARWAGQQSGQQPVPTVGPVSSLQERMELRMPSWDWG